MLETSAVLADICNRQGSVLICRVRGGWIVLSIAVEEGGEWHTRTMADDSEAGRAALCAARVPS